MLLDFEVGSSVWAQQEGFISVPQCVGPQLGRLKGWWLLNGWIQSYVWQLMLAFDWDFNLGSHMKYL